MKTSLDKYTWPLLLSTTGVTFLDFNRINSYIKSLFIGQIFYLFLFLTTLPKISKSVYKFNFFVSFWKVSIIPRGKGLGYAQYLPKEQYLYSKEQVKLLIFFIVCLYRKGRNFLRVPIFTVFADFDYFREIKYLRNLFSGLSSGRLKSS